MSQEWRIVFLLVAVFMAAAFVNLTSPLVQDWLSTTIPAGLRGRYLGRRWQMQGIAAIATTLCAGYLLDRIGKTNIHGISILLAGGTLFGVMAVLMLNRIKLPPVAVATTVTWSSIAEVIAYKPFRRYLWAYFLFNVPFYLSVPYYQVFNLEVLHMRPSTVGYILATYTGLRIITYGFWGRIIDRGYLKPAVYIPAVAYVFFFLGYPLSSPDRVWPLFIAWGLAGLADSATIVSTTALSYRSLPEGSATRPAYFAVLSLFSTGLYAIGALIAVPILVGLRHVTLTIGGLHLTHFHIFYFALMVMMVFSAIASRLFFAGDKPAPSAATATATD
jgi:MFS family permease